MVQNHIAVHSRDELEAMLVGIPCAPVNTVNEALNDAQSIAREAVVTVDGVEVLASPLRFNQKENNEV
jgi:crotonobetainyl-CoA:carnitine CoA-transferase CaiB-like acyl-CoA transferase